MSEQQHAYLKAMGIDVWVERNPTVSAPVQPEDPVHIETEQAAPIETQMLEPVNQVIPEPEPSLKIESLNLQELKYAVSDCELCDLSVNRSKTVFAAGDHNASLMILGDAPSKEDEQQGQLFTGEAGNLLTAMIKAMGYQRDDVYISTLVKCPIGENQDPGEEEVAACEAYFKRQVQLVQPKVILALGSSTAQRLLKSKSNMTRLRGQLHYIDDIAAPVIVTYEPGYLLRSPSEKRKAWEDLQMAMKELSNDVAATQ